MLKSAGIAIVACGLFAGFGRAADVDKLLPDDTEVVLTINVRQLRDSTLGRALLGQELKELKAGAAVQKLLSTSRAAPVLDLLKDDLATATLATAIPGTSADRGLLILRGKFDRAKVAAGIKALAGSDEPRAESAGAHVVYELQLPETKRAGQDVVYVALANGSTIVASPNKLQVHEALEKLSGKKSSNVKAGLRTAIQEVDPKQAVWTVALGTALSKGPLGGDEKGSQIFARIQVVTVGLTAGDNLRFDGRIAATSSEAARLLKKDLDDNVETAKSILALLVDKRTELVPVAEFLDTLTVTTTDATLVLRGRVSAEAIVKSLKWNP